VARNGVASSDSDPSVAVDNNGNVYVVWIARDRLPYLAVSRDGGATWSRPKMVGVPGLKEANLVAASASRGGRLVFAYLGSTNSPFQRCADDHEECDIPYSGTTWNGYVGVSSNSTAARPIFYTARVNRAKEPFVKGRCGPGRCYPVWDFIDVQIDGHAAWAAFVKDESNSRTSGEGVVATLRFATRDH
jgi:hypothetical protein